MLLLCRIDPAEVEKKAGKHVWKQHLHAKVTAQTHKMSKSRGNVVNPDDVVRQYGADSLRLYEMFLGPLQDTKVCLMLADAAAASCFRMHKRCTLTLHICVWQP